MVGDGETELLHVLQVVLAAFEAACLVQVGAGAADLQVLPLAPLVLAGPVPEKGHGRRLVGRDRVLEGDQAAAQQQEGQGNHRTPDVHLALLVITKNPAAAGFDQCAYSPITR
ncbi:hypothetical protein D3C81_2000390 [compost metagenome]